MALDRCAVNRPKAQSNLEKQGNEAEPRPVSGVPVTPLQGNEIRLARMALFLAGYLEH